MKSDCFFFNTVTVLQIKQEMGYIMLNLVDRCFLQTLRVTGGINDSKTSQRASTTSLTEL